MKKIGVLFILASMVFSSCSIDDSYIEVDYVNVRESSEVVSGFELVNGKLYYYEDYYNNYDFEISVVNQGDFAAYDVIVDVTIYLTSGNKVTHSHHIGNLESSEYKTIYQSESFLNEEVEDYYIDTYWTE